MSASAIEMQKRDAFAACAGFPIDGLETALDRAHEIAIRDELDTVARYIEEAQRQLRRIRILHDGALDEFNTSQGE
jgi:hypothetical protein